MRRAVSPDSVKMQRNFASTNSATSIAASVIAPPCVRGFVVSGAMRSRPWSSVEATMRAIVSTTTTGYLPTLVSPESMTASAPSRTALATSLVSARVGTGLSIIDSSICVATMTGLAMRRQSSTARFCTIGTASSGSSTPRSPRATMMPSNASMISSRLSTACGFSILAMTGMWRPSSAMITWTRWTSLALRTNDSAMRSAPRLQAPAQVGLVLLGQRGHVDRDAGQVDALVVRDRAADDDLGRDDGAVGLDDLDAHLAVVDQQEVAGLDVVRADP